MLGRQILAQRREGIANRVVRDRRDAEARKEQPITGSYRAWDG